MTASTAALPLARRREVSLLRLLAQGVATRPFASAVDAARHLTCVQGQQLPAALRALALRSATGAAPPAAALAAGQLVRGYPMRGTLFLTAAADLAWMTELTRDRQLAGLASSLAHRSLTVQQLTALADRAHAVLADGPLTRADFVRRLLPTQSPAVYHVCITLLLTGDIVYGPLDGKEQLVADAHTWLPRGSDLAGRFNGDADAATAHWLHRYLWGHGPATLRDFAWWSKLPLTLLRRLEPTATAGLESYGTDARAETLWGAPGLGDQLTAARAACRAAHLLPAFDEVVLGYPDRLLLADAAELRQVVPGNNGVFRATMHRAGRLVGTWQAARRGEVELVPFAPLSDSARRDFARAAAALPR
ncbi:DNA glycosylase AlkZ-like family protein [Buchananella hordeovulneris]|uniref:Winged helix DNA-binding domain-containing protein n=1 Tax=Buchananella hordeovulneris TaxID=52770 RepID=A0A1Q5PWD4_9ACTO|nr:crosslink repair DNA glycosylase YcaQ family protein [Buchananella hordeovulneris]OKL51924.1 hypothetical protein BSZ40_05430 [Buchananella hordeovulneris]